MRQRYCCGVHVAAESRRQQSSIPISWVLAALCTVVGNGLLPGVGASGTLTVGDHLPQALSRTGVPVAGAITKRSFSHGSAAAFLGVHGRAACTAAAWRWRQRDGCHSGSRRSGGRRRRGHGIGGCVSLYSAGTRKRRLLLSPSMDLGETDGIARTVLGPTTGDLPSSATASLALDPGQEACVSLDPETPAILLTAGAGTGKTHTLAARLARLLGVEIPRPTAAAEGNAMSHLSALRRREPGTGSLDDSAAVARNDSGGDGIGRQEVSQRGICQGLHAAPPESVWVLSFSKQRAQDVIDRAMAMGVPRSQASRIWATTFHALAASILRENVGLIWSSSDGGGDTPSQGMRDSRLSILSDAEQLALMSRALRRALPADSTMDEMVASRGSRRAHGLDCDSELGGGSSRGVKARSSHFGASWGMQPSLEDEKSGERWFVNGSRERVGANAILWRVKLWKEQGLTPENVRDRMSEITEDADRVAARTYREYQQLLQNRREVDFGDLCMMTTQLFSSHPEVLARYRWTLRHVLVDEYQDTSPAQLRLLKALVLGSSAAVSDNGPDGTESIGAKLDRHPGLGVSVFCAGDEDQHIYGWRGTTVDHLHSFENDFPGAVRRTLTHTHRLPVHILRSATGLMRAGGLVPVLNRRMRSRTNTGAVVRAQGLWNSREEGKWVGVEVARIHREQGISYKDIAVITRTAYNTRELEESLASRGVPYTVEGGSSFFSRPEVQAPLAMLALCTNPQDNEAFLHLVSYRPSTSGLLAWATPRTVQELQDFAAAQGVSIAEAARVSASGGGFVADKNAQDIAAFISGLRRWSGLLMGWPRQLEHERGAAVCSIFREAGFLPPLWDVGEPATLSPEVQGISAATAGGRTLRASDTTAKSLQEHESVRQLATAASRCDRVGRFLLRAARSREESRRKQSSRGHRGRGGRWEGVTWAAGKEDNEKARSNPSEESVELMTMHQAKGREFKVVFLTGWDEGSFPMVSGSSFDEDGEAVVESLAKVQEERRLGYVALTRAKEHAIITFAKQRRFKDAWIDSAGPSRFLLEMPEEYVTVSPNAAERIIDDYPGRAFRNTITFQGLIKEGKLRRNRPVLPSAAEIDAYNAQAPSSLNHRRKRGEDIIIRADGRESSVPAGCTIIDRSASLLASRTDSNSHKNQAGRPLRRRHDHDNGRDRLSLERKKSGRDGKGAVKAMPTSAPAAECPVASATATMVETATDSVETVRVDMMRRQSAPDLDVGSAVTRTSSSTPLATTTGAAVNLGHAPEDSFVGAGDDVAVSSAEITYKNTAANRKDNDDFRQALASAGALLNSFSSSSASTSDIAIDSQDLDFKLTLTRDPPEVAEVSLERGASKAAPHVEPTYLFFESLGRTSSDLDVAHDRTARRTATPDAVVGHEGKRVTVHGREYIEDRRNSEDTREDVWTEKGASLRSTTIAKRRGASPSKSSQHPSAAQKEKNVKRERVDVNKVLVGGSDGATSGVYNPEPTYLTAAVTGDTGGRGRKKKMVLDASVISKENTVEADKIMALVGDPAINQMSLKNFLRAVLAVQHSCARGAIPIHRPRSADGAGKKPMEAGLGKSEKTAHRLALSQCSAQDLAGHILHLLSVRKKGITGKPAER